jgi:hypothetical protein
MGLRITESLRMQMLGRLATLNLYENVFSDVLTDFHLSILVSNF